MAERTSFLLYFSFANQFELLSLEERGILITAIFEYTKSGQTTVEMSPLVRMAFTCMKESLDRDRENYEEKCRINEENGRKGGRPRKNSSAPKTERFCEYPEKANTNSNTDSNSNNNSDINTNTESEGNTDNGGYGAFETGAYQASAFSASAAVSDPAPRLDEEDKSLLLGKGLPARYIDERAERAAVFGGERGMSAYEVLLDWWKTDRAKPPWNGERISRPQSEPPKRALSIYEDDEAFFQARVNMIFDE